jgi:glycosyltransferase involved in cell wall biosynthesis
VTNSRERRSDRVLIISQDRVGPQMAGPGIRSWEFACYLCQEFQVTLAAPGPAVTRNPASQREPAFGEGRALSFDIIYFDPSDPAPLRQATAETDVVIVGGYLLRAYPFLLSLSCPLVIDAYIPYPLEAIELQSQYPMTDQVSANADAVLTLDLQFLAGDHFICASERQRDLWLGILLALGRINPESYFRDRSLRRLIDVVPFGLPEEPPHRTRPVLRGIHPSVSQDDRVILWGGGIWQWLDPLTLIRAVHAISSRMPDVRLFFPGVSHPDADVAHDMAMQRAARQLSDELRLTGETVIFGDWLPYSDRQNYLLEADLGVSLHFDIAETRFAYRTRLLDYIWAGLPIVATQGDCLSEVVQQQGLGRVVQAEDVAGLAATLMEILVDHELRERLRPNFQAVAAQFMWPRVLEPLARICRSPQRAVDRQMTVNGVYAAWIGSLLESSRSSQSRQTKQTEEHIASLQEQVRNQQLHIALLQEQVRNQQLHIASLQEQVQSSFYAKVTTALRQLRN